MVLEKGGANIKKQITYCVLSKTENHKNNMVLRLILKMFLFSDIKGVILQLYHSKDNSNLLHDKKTTMLNHLVTGLLHHFQLFCEDSSCLVQQSSNI